MPALLRDPVARFVALTAAVGSLADWTLFAALVAVVDDRTAGSAWATAAVLLARVLPATVFAPLAARRVDRLDLRLALSGHELGRALAVGVIALVAPTSPLAVAAVLLVGLEFMAAMQAAARESLVSRRVPRSLHPAVNTATAVAGYGLLPVGALVVQVVGPTTALAVAAGAYVLVLAAYVGAFPGGGPRMAAVGLHAGARGEVLAAEVSRGGGGAGLVRTVAAAAIGLAPVVAMFTVAPRLAEAWTGDATGTGLPLGLLLAGAAAGLVLANRGRTEAQGLAVATAGFAAAGLGLWQPGLVVAGLGTGLAYLALQTRLQAEASDPSQFARAFAVLKVATIAGTVAGPVLWDLGGASMLLAASSVAAATALVVATGGEVLRTGLRAVVRRAVLVGLDVHVEGVRHEGPAVVASNHPNAVDGVVALAADPTLRPIARWQRNRIARAGFWLAEAVVTTAGTDRDHVPAWQQAAAHLDRGGRIWLAPEGGAHAEHDLRTPRSGAVRMAHAAGVPIQVLGIRHHDHHAGPRLRAWRPWRRPTVTLVWGDVVRPGGHVEADNDAMMAALARASGMRWAGPVGTGLARAA